MINKNNKKVIFKSIALIALAILVMPNIYFIAGKLGISLAPKWYQEIVNWISAGGTISGAFAAVLGVTVPAWLASAAAAFGLASA